MNAKPNKELKELLSIHQVENENSILTKGEEFLLKPIHITEEELEGLEKNSKLTEALKRLMNDN